jgi:hypothetical protein
LAPLTSLNTEIGKFAKTGDHVFVEVALLLDGHKLVAFVAEPSLFAGVGGVFELLQQLFQLQTEEASASEGGLSAPPHALGVSLYSLLQPVGQVSQQAAGVIRQRVGRIFDQVDGDGPQGLNGVQLLLSQLFVVYPHSRQFRP